MSEVKWIKICTDIFDDEKISLIDGMPDRDGIIVIWFKLLCMAGKQNNGGVFMLNDKIAYTDEMLATIFRRPLNTVRLALKTFEQFGMVNIINNAYTIPNWEKHQSLGKLEAAKEKNRLRVAAHRERQKQLAQCNDYSNGDVMPCNDADIDTDIDLDKDIDKKKEDKVDCQQIVDLFHSICKSFPTVRSLSESRKRAIKARLNTYTIDDFRTLFENAEASSFLKGNNERNWSANFDWLIKDSKMPRVIEGDYSDKPQQTRYTRQEKKPNWMQPSLELGEEELAAIRKMMGTGQTVGNDPSVAEEAEAMQQRLREKYGRKEA